ncbi:hypothetical protein [Sinimarinibacterium flocculans]|uniref:hypothetical protein n=1 Tax=Sinimarinibacterium flocculans TaxID=985250 RepID=UPI0035192303
MIGLIRFAVAAGIVAGSIPAIAEVPAVPQGATALPSLSKPLTFEGCADVRNYLNGWLPLHEAADRELYLQYAVTLVRNGRANEKPCAEALAIRTLFEYGKAADAMARSKNAAMTKAARKRWYAKAGSAYREMVTWYLYLDEDRRKVLHTEHPLGSDPRRLIGRDGIFQMGESYDAAGSHKELLVALAEISDNDMGPSLFADDAVAKWYETLRRQNAFMVREYRDDEVRREIRACADCRMRWRTFVRFLSAYVESGIGGSKADVWSARIEEIESWLSASAD